ncbi:MULTISPECIES: superinfection immunity protein [Pseudomonas]|uniref:superinfection immunity protein n=1 Tax=Pseudomonas juntendi TaxID=2666183 RepID=UPI0021754513|nr:superinfection immunity protein [Pseudomonas juntendi]
MINKDSIAMAVDTSAYYGVANVVVVALFYFPPTIVAWLRQHPNRVSIFLLNLLLGWTVIGWLIALIWSASAIRRAPPAETRSAPESPDSRMDDYQRLEQLAALKERGHLTQEEFDVEKRRILRGR